MYTLKFDGLFHEEVKLSNGKIRAGFIGYGWLIYKRKRLIARGFGVFALDKYAASNIAEYLALIEGLEALSDFGVQGEMVEIRGDAKCVIDQMRGETRVSSLPTQKVNRQAARLAEHFSNLIWRWVPRQDNREADRLTKHAIREMRYTEQSFRDTLKLKPAASILDGKLIPVIDLRVYQV